MKRIYLLVAAILLCFAVVFMGCKEEEETTLIEGTVTIGNSPDAVSALKAVAYPGCILVTWSAAINTDGYAIYRSDGSNNILLDSSLDADTVWYLDVHNFTNNRLENDKSYTYTIKSVNMNLYGNVAEAKTSVKANIPVPRTNISSSFTNTAADIEVITYKNDASDTYPNRIIINIKNMNPIFDYSINVNQGLNPIIASAVNLTAYDAGKENLLEGTKSTDTISLTTYTPGQECQVQVTYTVKYGFDYTVTTALSANVISKTFTP
ncbi:MAG: hypothetical protein FWB95_09335 [Treponema sp.]|nr:hypothetical protein [Treponema sp.]